MAHKKNKSNTPWTQVTFVRCELSKEDKAAFSKWVAAKDFHPDAMAQTLCETGYKLSFSHSEANDSFICSITGKPEGCDNPSKCMTSHAKSWLQALQVALFKHFVIHQAGVWEEFDDAADFG